MKILETQCDCKICSEMCKAPCCGTPQEMQALIDNGLAKKLSFDDYESPGQIAMIKPALKGHGGKRAPWEVRSERGCAFWKKGKCELHEKGLKPLQGRLANHAYRTEECKQIESLITESWEDGKGKQVIENWKKECEK